jgi:hypothetical protein
MADITDKIPFRLPWFLFDINNYQLITATTVPTSVSDNKNVILSETPIPGRNNAPVTPAGGGNRKLSISIPIMKRNELVGNALTIRQLDRLRQQAGTIFSPTTQFTPQPKVLYYWGTGSVPLEYYVAKVSFTHHGEGWVNAIGFPQYTDVTLDLVLDEDSFLYRVEEVWRELASYLGIALGVVDVIRNQQGKAVM